MAENTPSSPAPDSKDHGLRWAIDLPTPLDAHRLRATRAHGPRCATWAPPSRLTIPGCSSFGLETLPLRIGASRRELINGRRVPRKHPFSLLGTRYPGPQERPRPRGGRTVPQEGLRRHRWSSASKAVTKPRSTLIDSIPLFSHHCQCGRRQEPHPALPRCTSHSQLSSEQQPSGGLTPDLVRLSIGIEHIDDIIEALEAGLASA
jgi:O-acetylhomoserine (thiol)-lyase